MKNYYNENIKLLSAKNSNLISKLDNIELSNLNMKKTRSNKVTATYRGDLINSLNDPMLESQYRIDAISNNGSVNLIYVVGFGLGYEINEILHRNDNALILIAIVNLEIFKFALTNLDLSNIINHPTVFFADATIEDFRSEFARRSRSNIFFGKSIDAYLHPFYNVKFPELVQKTYREMFDGYIYNSTNVGNSALDNLEGIVNILGNTKKIANSLDLSELKGRFKDVPAVCVASGPSLNKNIEQLKGISKKALVFVADTIWEKLDSEDIDYHGIGVLERPQIIYEKLFKGKSTKDNTVLFGASVIEPKIFEEHNGNSVLLFKESTFVERFMSECLGDLNALQTGISVAHLNFMLAEYLGCSPIILVGQDLAYSTDGHSHALGTIHEKNTLNDDIEKGKLNREIFVDSIDGKKIRTTKVWKMFLDFFEMEIEQNKIKCVDASEGGAFIKGSEVITLEEAIIKYCKKDLEIDFHSLFHFDNEEVRLSRIDMIENELIKQYEFLVELEKWHLETLELIEEISTYSYEKILKYKHKLDKINRYIYDVIDVSPLFSFIVQSMLVTLGRKNNELGLIQSDDDFKVWLQSQEQHFRSVEKIRQLTTRLLKETLDSYDSIKK